MKITRLKARYPISYADAFSVSLAMEFEAPIGVKIARRTRRIVTQNIAMALGIKLIFIALGIFGEATMWEAVFSDVGVALLAVGNALRILR